MPAKADRIGDLYIAEKGNVNRMAEKKIGEIKEELKAVDDEKLPSFIETYEKDVILPQLHNSKLVSIRFLRSLILIL